MADRTPKRAGGDLPVSVEEAMDYAEEIVVNGTEKAMGVIARFDRNANRFTELEIARARLASDAADREARNILAELRLYETAEEHQRQDAERRARREAQTAARARDADYREEQAQYRRERDATRQAYQEAQAQARAERRDTSARQQQYGQVARTIQPSAPSVSTGTPGVIPTGGGWAPDKSAVAKFIIFATALGAIGAVANDLQSRAVATKLPDGTKVPAHLRALGGVFIAGTVALVVNEVYPGAGAVLGAGIVGLIVIPNWTPLIAKIMGSSTLWGAKKAPPPPTIPRSLPGNQALPPSASLPGGGMYGNLTG